MQEHTSPEKLEKYSFFWSEARLVIAAIALFLGGVPPVTFLSLPSGLIGSILTLSWVISGLAAGYLLYRWFKVKTLFGVREKMDLYAFFVMVISGLNLGVVGLFRTNIGMSISSAKLVFLATGVLYLVAAYHLHRRFMANGGRLF